MTNLFRKVASGVVAMAVVATSALNIGAVTSANFVSAEFTDAFAWAKDQSITSMPTEEAFMPFAAATREAGATLIVRAFNAIENATGETLLTMDADANCTFADAVSFDSTLVSAINDACNYGLIKGYNGKFWPKQLMTRAQVMTVVGRALYGQQPEPAKYWSNYYSLLNADGIFTIENANANIMRYELLLVLYRIAMSNTDGGDNGGDDLDDVLCQLLGTCEDPATEPTEPTTEPTEPTTEPTEPTTGPVTIDGNLQVAVSSDSPAASRVPAGAVISAVTYDLTAGTTETVKVYGINLAREGLSDRCTYDAIAAFTEAGRVTRARTENSDGVFSLSFSPALEIAAGETVSLTVVADTARDSNDNGIIDSDELECAQSTQVVLDIVDVTANTDVVYNSTRGATHEILNVVAATLKVEKDGSISDVSVGDVNVEVASFSFVNDDRNDLEVHGITLRDDESIADTAFENFKLYCDGDMVGALDYTMNAYVTVAFDTPVVVESKKDVDCELRADVVGEPNEMFGFYLDEELDVVAVDLDYNSAGVAINNQYRVAQTAKIDAGEITLSKININHDEIRADKDDLVIADFNIFAAQDVEWRDVSFDIMSTNLNPSTGNVCTYLEKEEFELWDEDTGSRYALDVNTCAGTAKVSDKDVAIMLKGKKHFTLRAATTENAMKDNKFYVKFSRDDNRFYEMSDDQRVTDITPSAVSRQNIEVVDSGLDLTVLPMGDTSSVIGYQGVQTMNFELEANDSSDIKVTEIVAKWNLVDASSSATARLVVGDPQNFAGETYTFTVTCGSDVNTATAGPLSTNATTGPQANENDVAQAVNGIAGVTASNSAVDGYVDVTMPNSTCSIKVESSTMNSNIAVTNPTATVLDAVSEDHVSAVHLYRVESDGTMTLIDTESNINTDGSIKFNSLSEMIDAGDDVEYVVTADIVDDTGIVGKKMQFEIVSVDAEDDDGDTVTVSMSPTPAKSARIITIVGVGKLVVKTNNTDSKVTTPELVLGDTTSDVVAAFDLTASDEAVKIKELHIEGSESDFATYVTKVALYDKDMKLVDSKNVTSSTVKFDNINYVANEGTSTLYAVITARRIGKDYAGKQSNPLTLTLTVVEADWVDSGDDAMVTQSTVASTSFSVVPVVLTGVKSTSSNTCTLGANTTIAQFEVKANNGNNTEVADGSDLTTFLKTVRFKVSQANVSGGTFTLKRAGTPIQSTTNSVDGTLANGVLTFTIPAGNVNFEVDDMAKFQVEYAGATINDNASISTEFDASSADPVIEYASSDTPAQTINYILSADVDFPQCKN